MLDALAAGSASTAELARETGATDERLLETFLRVVASAGLIRGGGDEGPWRLTSRGRAVIDDPLVRASYEGFPGLHTALYRDLGPLLAGGPRRRDIAESGELIARLSGGFEPLVLGRLTRAVTERAPRRVLDVGCGAAFELAAVLAAVPQAEGVGLDVDAGAVELAGRTLASRGLGARARVLHLDVREAAMTGPSLGRAVRRRAARERPLLPADGRAGGVPADDRGAARPRRCALRRHDVAAPQFFSRHFDLLLQAQEGEMELSDADTLADQLRQAGFVPGPVEPVAAGRRSSR